MYMKQIVTLAITAMFATSLLGPSMVQAQSSDDSESTTSSIQQIVQSLLEQIKVLQERLDELKAARGQDDSYDDSDEDTADSFVPEIKERLRMGDNNAQVRKLQELLASDSEIYPERLVTGYFGPLTESALARFQARHGATPTGELDDNTRALINEYFANRGNDEAPEGLLRAPGIKRIVERGVCDRIRGNVPFCPRDTEDDDEDENEDSDDDATDEQADAAEDAQDAINDAEEAIAELEDEIDEFGDTLSESDLEEALAFLQDAQDYLSDAQSAYDEGKYEEAEELADQAEDAAKDGDSIVEDPDDDDSDDDDEEDDDSDDDDQSTS